MKTKRTRRTSRFLSVFLLVTLLLGLCAAPSAAALEDPNIQAEAALLVDPENGAIAYAKNEHKQLYPASLTKIMTALLTLEAVDSGKLKMDQKITASPTAFQNLAEDGSTGGIKPGEVMTVEQLLYCMMVVSANEACSILAETVAGSIPEFVDAMNKKAKELGCENTHFMNPSGLHDNQHYTSAWDLYLIIKEAMTHPDFMRICDTGDITLPATNMSKERHLHSTNYLLSVFKSRGYRNKNAHGIKTGHTSEAGYCLASSAAKSGLHFISIVMGTERLELPGNEIRTMSFYETNRLFNWAFANFSYRTVAKSTESVQDIDVSLSHTADRVAVHPAEDVNILLPSDLNPEKLERTIHLKKDPAEAPIQEDEVLGTMTFSYDGQTYATVDLQAVSAVEASKLLTVLHKIKLFFSKTAVKVVLVLIVILLVARLVWKIIFSRRRYRSGRRSGRNSGGGYRGRRWRF